MRTLRFFCIDAHPGTSNQGLISRADQPFGEMDPITAEQAVQAIAHSAQTGSEIELYLCQGTPADPQGYGPTGTPLVGFCFTAGQYVGHGLGDCPDDPTGTAPLEQEALVTTDWLSFFRRALQPA